MPRRRAYDFQSIGLAPVERLEARIALSSVTAHVMLPPAVNSARTPGGGLASGIAFPIVARVSITVRNREVIGPDFLIPRSSTVRVGTIPQITMRLVPGNVSPNTVFFVFASPGRFPVKISLFRDGQLIQSLNVARPTPKFIVVLPEANDDVGSMDPPCRRTEKVADGWPGQSLRAPFFSRGG